MRTAIAALIRRLRLEPVAQWLYVRLVPVARRNQRDNDHQRLLLAFCLAADANCVDVGAHGGAVLREMIRIAPDGRHVAFEPLPAQAARLRREFPRVDVREVALSDVDGEARFVHVRSNPELSGLRERAYPGPQQLETLTVPTQRLDAALPEGYVPALVKIDVEGAELLVLRGALETLRAHRPLLMFEHGAGAADAYAPDASAQIHDLLSGLGMRIFDIDGGGPYSRAKFVAAFTRPLWVWVAH